MNAREKRLAVVVGMIIVLNMVIMGVNYTSLKLLDLEPEINSIFYNMSFSSMSVGFMTGILGWYLYIMPKFKALIESEKKESNG